MMLRKMIGVVLASLAVVLADEDPAADQLVIFKNENPNPVGMTTAAGAPINYNLTSSLNKPLINNEYFMDAMTHFVRERIPERVVHAKGAGAFGYFEVTNDLSDICKAKLFSEVGKKTPIAVRFSPSSPFRGGMDTFRDSRGFAVKFYTEDGNFDIAGFDTPMFFMKDPILFPSLIRIGKPNPVTNLIDPNMVWDFLTQRPETLFIFLLILGDRGVPDGYRHMPGFSIHTYQVSNNLGEKHFIRFHFIPDAGIQSLNSTEAATIGSSDPDSAIRDLYEAIGSSNFPSWTCYVQVLNETDVKNATFDVFDATKILPKDKYPLRKVGNLILNQNPTNNFADIEQLAFCPGNLVPGIQGGPDKLFEARRLAYRDAQLYRLGANFLNIPVNSPLQTTAFTYNRDGVPPVNDNQKSRPNYYPNTFNGPKPQMENNTVDLIQIYEEEANNFEQAGDWYVNEMTEDEKSRLVANIVASLSLATDALQKLAIEKFSLINEDLSARIKSNLQNN